MESYLDNFIVEIESELMEQVLFYDNTGETTLPIKYVHFSESIARVKQKIIPNMHESFVADNTYLLLRHIGHKAKWLKKWID